jgi:hypothetical protein
MTKLMQEMEDMLLRVDQLDTNQKMLLKKELYASVKNDADDRTLSSDFMSTLLTKVM